jgi:hypothetical protein
MPRRLNNMDSEWDNVPSGILEDIKAAKEAIRSCDLFNGPQLYDEKCIDCGTTLIAHYIKPNAIQLFCIGCRNSYFKIDSDIYEKNNETNGD